MGREHLDYLKAEGLPAESRGYDMVAKDLIDFQTLTDNLKRTREISLRCRSWTIPS